MEHEAGQGVVIRTDVVMDQTAVLTVCFATLESGGMNDNDYIEITRTFVQSHLAFAAPHTLRRVPVGTGPHEFLISPVIPAELYVLTSSPSSCASLPHHKTGIDIVASTTQTASVKVVPGETSVQITVPKELSVGHYALCRARVLGVNQWSGYESMAGVSISIEALPTLSIEAARAGVPTRFALKGARDGDWVVMQEGGCNNAHKAVDSSTSLGKTRLTAAAGAKEAWASTTAQQNVRSTLYVCYATFESGGNEEHDFIAINTPFYQLPLTAPLHHRIVAKSGPHTLHLPTLLPSEHIHLQRVPTCSDTTTPLSPTRGANASGTSGGGGGNLTIGSHLLPGVYHLCYSPTPIGRTRIIDGLKVEVVALPEFKPESETAHSELEHINYLEHDEVPNNRYLDITAPTLHHHCTITLSTHLSES